MTTRLSGRWPTCVALCVAWVALVQAAAHAQDIPPATAAVVSYGPEGLAFGTDDTRFRLVLGGRIQARYAAPFEDDPLDPEELGRERETLTRIRRARARASGHLFSPRFTFAVQYDLVNTWLLDARVNYELRPWLQVRAGQWKADYNRERVASSGEQQLVERSIVNREFTIDRQNGVAVHGRVAENRRGDSTYWVGVFNGGGRSRGNDDRRPLWVARYQWNVAGGGLDFRPVDLDRTSEVRAIIAVGASVNQSPYSRFASDGPGQVDDLPGPTSGQYLLAQWVGEAALKWRGVSVQQEVHWKRVTDRETGAARRLMGVYVQGGFFPHERWRAVPRPLEIVGRYARVDPDADSSEDHRDERTAGANWYIGGHRNKLSLDVSRLLFDTLDGVADSSTRVRVQWDISF